MNVEQLDHFLRILSFEEVAGVQAELPVVSDERMSGALREIDLTSDQPFRIVRHGRLCHTPEHGHDFYEMMFVLQGTVTHKIEKQEIILPAGSVLLMKPGVRHEVLPCSLDDLAVSVTMGKKLLLPAFLNTLSRLPGVGKLFLTDNSAPFMKLVFGKDSLAYQCGQRLLCSYFDSYYHSEISTELLLQLFLTELDRLILPEHNQSKENIEREMEKIARFIQMNYATVTIEELAKQYGYTASYISRNLKKQFGSSFVKYRNQQRLLAAATFLITTQKTITAIAGEVGISSLSHFYRMFLEEYSLTPIEYRRQYQI